MFLLVVGALLGCSGLIVPFLISLIINVTSRETNDELQLRQEIVELRRHLQTVSMVDQFPVYAKFQRKIIALTSQYKQKLNERQMGTQKLKLIINGVLKVVVFICYFYVVWNHKNMPVTTIPSGLLWPIAPVLSLPSCQSGEISFVIWLGLAKMASAKIHKILQKKGNLSSATKLEGKGFNAFSP